MDTLNGGKEWVIRRYTREQKEVWDNFVESSRNAHFMHFRGYMDYHADRFKDHSLMAYKGERLLAILPANEEGDVLCSHRGLTFGGWLMPQKHLDGSDLLKIFATLTVYMQKKGFRTLIYKPIPYIYFRKPSQEDIYALFRIGGTIEGCNLSETVNLSDTPGLNTMTRRHLRKAKAIFPDREMSEIIKECEVSTFYPLLEECLRERHNTTPVHTHAELEKLQTRYPENIRCFICDQGERGRAGVCIYEWRGVAHCQYIATDETGRRNHLLTLVFDYLINTRYSGMRYFDFGTSNEDGGRYLNEGLLRQKSGYGASGVSYLIYNYMIPSYEKVNPEV